MCIVSFHIREHPIYKLVLIANRDEKYDRPTEKAHFWQDAPDILAGRDLKALGTWMGITKQGRFAALTNYRNPLNEGQAVKSRGRIVADYLNGKDSAEAFLQELSSHKEDYNGFNLIIGTVDELFFYNKIDDQIIPLKPGTYSISNARLNTPWPKVEKARTTLREYMLNHTMIQPQTLFEQLADDTFAKEDQLPDTGVGKALEKQLSPIFIQTDGYGTRSSTVLLVSHQNEVTFLERTFKEGKLSDLVIEETFQID